MSETIDLFAKLKKKANGAAPPTQEQIAAEPALGVNPPMPEGTPLAPPVGTVEAKPKRGRPKKTAETAAPVAEPVKAEATISLPAACVHPELFDDAGFDAAWNELGSAVKKFLKTVGA